jgi:transposase
METKNKQLDFTDQNIYVGLDAHKKQFTVSIQSEYLFHKTFSQPPKPEVLVNHLRHNFPGANYYAAYEAGYSGFWIQEKLQEFGVNCIVVNPADVLKS